MRLRSTSLGSVSHRRFSGATAGDFSWVSNTAFRNALVEAANTGLVTGFSSLAGQEQYWLRGARYPHFTAIPGATCTRTGSRAGLDAAVIYPANVPRVAPSVGPGPELYSNQVATFDNSAGGATASYNSGTQTVSVTVAGSDAGYPRLRYSLGIVSGRSYRVTGRIDGARTGVNVIRLATSGSANSVPYNSTTGVFDGIVTANGTALEFAFNGTVTGDRNIAALSVREYRDAGSGLRVFGAGTNLLTASEALNTWSLLGGASAAVPAIVAPDGSLASLITGASDLTVPTGGNNIYRAVTVSPSTQYTASIWLRAGTATTAGINFFDDTTGGNTSQTISVDTIWRRVTVTRTSGVATTAMRLTVGGANGTVAAWGGQVEASPFASDYIPNPNTGASSSAGDDDVRVAASALPAASSIVFLIDLPAQAFTGPANIRAFEWNNVIGAAFETNAIVTAVPVGATLPSVTGLANAGARRIAILHTVGAPTKMSVNGSATVTGTNVGGAIPATTLFLGNRSALDRALSGAITAFAAYPGSPSDAQLQAMSAL